MSNKGMPSLLALLGLVAVAGYQNRDKLRDMIADARTGAGTAGGAAGTGWADCSTRSAGPSAAVRTPEHMKEGLGSLLDRFRTNGQGEKANSRVSADADAELGDGDLQSAVGNDTLDELARRVGLCARRSSVA